MTCALGRHTGRDLELDLQAAGIPKHTPAGMVDFHACRLAYFNLVIESDATVKETQTLARHSTPDVTMYTYRRTRQERLSTAVEQVAASISAARECVTYVSRLAVGAEAESATPVETGGCASEEWWRRRESNPRSANAGRGHYHHGTSTVLRNLHTQQRAA
jgi:hypothetical protein